MSSKLNPGTPVIFFLLLSLFIISCGKGGGGNTPAPNPCPGITVNVTATINNPGSPGASNGSISAAATGGSGFTFSLNGGAFQSSGTFANLPAGSYNITAKNSNGCTGTSTFTLTAPDPCAGVIITVSGTSVNPSAPGATNGSITASASGGSGSFTFSISNGAFQSSGTFSNLGSGSYLVTARDANGCTGSANFTLTAPNPCAGITITVTGTSVNPSAPGANNGSISASASGGTGSYTFSINGGAFQSSGIFSGLAAGIYTITARDANTCSGSTSFTLVDPNPCAGVTISVGSNITGNTPCASPPTGTITVLPSGGVTPYTYSLNGGAFQPSGIFSNLPAANFSITVKDANNCTGTGTATVNNLPQGPLFSQVKTLIQANCVPCHNTVSPNGGMNFEVDCNIVLFKDRIVARAVNANPSPMPPTGLLPASERQKIIDWVNAGGRYTD